MFFKTFLHKMRKNQTYIYENKYGRKSHTPNSEVSLRGSPYVSHLYNLSCANVTNIYIKVQIIMRFKIILLLIIFLKL